MILTIFLLVLFPVVIVGKNFLSWYFMMGYTYSKQPAISKHITFTGGGDKEEDERQRVHKLSILQRGNS